MEERAQSSAVRGEGRATDSTHEWGRTRFRDHGSYPTHGPRRNKSNNNNGTACRDEQLFPLLAGPCNPERAFPTADACVQCRGVSCVLRALLELGGRFPQRCASSFAQPSRWDREKGGNAACERTHLLLSLSRYVWEHFSISQAWNPRSSRRMYNRNKALMNLWWDDSTTKGLH
jgi:hypothetical protein